jgi:hypothetical protein
LGQSLSTKRGFPAQKLPVVLRQLFVTFSYPLLFKDVSTWQSILDERDNEGLLMDAEQRIAIRKMIRLDILINYEHYSVSFPRLWKTRDLSACGAFVEMHHVELPAEARIEAVLVLEYQDHHEPHSLPAEVVRVSVDGIALRFGGYTERTYAALCTLLENSH